MKVGTKSLFWGVHQVFLHPIFVAIAWNRLYGWYPDHCYRSWSLDLPKYWLSLILCFIVHDWGYFGLSEMDGPEGDKHPVFGAQIAHLCLDQDKTMDSTKLKSDLESISKWYYFCICHSRFYAKKLGLQPSKLCMADKLCIVYYPDWLYLLLGNLSGEIKEYMADAKLNGKYGHMKSEYFTQRQWLASTKAYMMDYALIHQHGLPDIIT